MSIERFTDRRHDADVLDSAGNAVRLWRPDAPGGPWAALTFEMSSRQVTHVIWQRGQPSTYVCEKDGSGPRFDHCPHTAAALAAADDLTKETP